MGRRRTFIIFSLIGLLSVQVACKSSGGGGGPKISGGGQNNPSLLDVNNIPFNDNQNQGNQFSHSGVTDSRFSSFPSGFDISGGGRGAGLDPAVAGSGPPAGAGGLAKPLAGSHAGDSVAAVSPPKPPVDPKAASKAGATDPSAARGAADKPGAVTAHRIPRSEDAGMSSREQFERELAARTNAKPRDPASTGGVHGAIDTARRQITDLLGSSQVNLASPKIEKFPEPRGPLPDYVTQCIAKVPDGTAVTVPHVRDGFRDGKGHFASQGGRVMSINHGRIRISMTIDLLYPDLGPDGKREKILAMERERDVMVDFFAQYGIEMDLTFMHDPQAKPGVLARLSAFVHGAHRAMHTSNMDNWASTNRGKPMNEQLSAYTHLHELGHMLGLHDEYAEAVGPTEAKKYEKETNSLMNHHWENPKLYPRHLQRILGPLCGT